MKRNAYFQLIHETDGLYLQSFPAVEGGASLRQEDILDYLDRKRIGDVDSITIKRFVEAAQKQEHARARISDAGSLPERETALITLDKHHWYAKIRLYPPSSQGSYLTLEELYSLIGQAGVTYGIIDRNVELLWKSKLYCTDVLIARATMPVQGSHAEVAYHFNVDKTSKPAMLEDGSVDFHSLDMIERVQEGQLLATLTPEVPGTPGTTVTGETIPPARVRKKALKHGKHIRLDAEKLHLYSEVSGNVTLVNDTVFVSNVYEVPADVGTSTGDILYEGSVEIKGNVLSGYTVEADGDIIVNGTVEAAKLKAGGKIVLKNGVQGMGKAELKAGGDVISNFIESASVKAGGKVMTEAIMHSQVEAQGEIEVEGRRGMIAGGRVRSTKMISMKVAGSTMGTQTELEVGTDPTLLDRYQNVEKEMERISNERDSLLQNIAILKKRLQMTGALDEDKRKKLKDSAARIQEIGTQMESLTEEYEQLDQQIEAATGGGKIEVRDIAYPGVKLTISNVSTYLHTESQYCTFVRDGADIRTRGIL